MKNLFYFRHINCIGGIEQFFAYLTNKYRDWDITIVYKTGDPQQIARLRKYAKVIKFTGQNFECDKAFFCFNQDISDHVIAKEYFLVLHGDYKAMVEQKQLDSDCYIFKSDFDKYIGVSQVVCDAWTDVTGKPAIVSYNPFIKEPIKNYLRIVYCGRLTEEKGGELAMKLINRLDERSIDYLFYVYSNKTTIDGNRVINLGTRLDAGQFLNQHNYDYLLVPSKNEGYCYSLVQALSNGLPAVVTPCPVFKELGVNEENSIRLEFDGSNIDEVIDLMLSKSFSFSYEPKSDNWDKILEPGPSEYKYEPVKVRSLVRYYDCEFNKQMYPDEVFEVVESRAEELLAAGVVVREE